MRAEGKEVLTQGVAEDYPDRGRRELARLARKEGQDGGRGMRPVALTYPALIGCLPRGRKVEGICNGIQPGKDGHKKFANPSGCPGSSEFPIAGGMQELHTHSPGRTSKERLAPMGHLPTSELFHQ